MHEKVSEQTPSTKAVSTSQKRPLSSVDSTPDRPKTDAPTELTIYVDLEDMPTNPEWTTRKGQYTQSPYHTGEDKKALEYYFQVSGKVTQARLLNQEPYGHSISIAAAKAAADKINAFCQGSPAAAKKGIYKRPIENSIATFKYVSYSFVSCLDIVNVRCADCKTCPDGSIDPRSCDASPYRSFWPAVAVDKRNVIPAPDELPTLAPNDHDEERASEFVQGIDVIVEFMMSSYTIEPKPPKIAVASVKLSFMSIGLVPREHELVDSPKRSRIRRC